MKKMLRVDVYLGNSIYETFFVDKQEEIESRIEGYQMLLGSGAKISYKVSIEDGDAETHDLWGY